MIDLHSHTNISDGAASPVELIRTAKETGLTAVALTDHDNISGLDEAQGEADRLDITLVKGIEFSVSYGENRLIHILGLGIDPLNDTFLDIYTRYRRLRESRLDHVFLELRKRDVFLEREDVIPYLVDDHMDRQAIARCLVGRGYAPMIRNAWINYLDKIPYIPGELILPEEAFEAIHAAGGKSFMAHFHLPIGLKGYTDEEARRRLGQLKEFGLDGLEYYYPSFTGEDRERCACYLEDFGFLKSGGTDYHGANRPHIKLGIGEGDFSVPDELLDNILPAGRFALTV